jgi:small subunit ribosomal protein S21
LANVEVNPGESFESALRRFKRKVQQEAIVKEIKKHSVYLKPGEKKRLKLAQAQKRMRKRLRRETTDF